MSRLFLSITQSVLRGNGQLPSSHTASAWFIKKKNLFDYWVLLTVFAPGDSERQQAAQWKLADCHRGRAFPSLWL